jgi:GGDEF domain-containing protein
MIMLSLIRVAIIGLLYSSIGFTSYAWSYSSPVLNEASVLLDISPAESRWLTAQYLNQRQLSDRNQTVPTSLPHESEKSVRSPATSVEALEILAQAQFKLGNSNEAFLYINRAAELCEQYQLSVLAFQVATLNIDLQWQKNNKAGVARKALRELLFTIDTTPNINKIAQNLRYGIKLLRAQIASKENDIELADLLFSQLKMALDEINSTHLAIDYHIELANHYLTHRRNNLALSELLIAYWSAVENNSSAQLAKINSLLAELFYERQVFDKSLSYLSQAADFYRTYENSPALTRSLKMMGDIYYQQGRYNFALVHYLNVIDHQINESDLKPYISIRINLAATYLKLNNYPLSAQYIALASALLEHTHVPQLSAQLAQVKAELAFAQHQNRQAFLYANKALKIAVSIKDSNIKQRAYQQLSLSYEQEQNYSQALHYARLYNALYLARQDTINELSEDAFRQQKEFVEKTLHFTQQEQRLSEQEKNYTTLQNITFSLFFIAAIMVLLLLKRGYVIQRQHEEIDSINSHLFTHSRSGLNNLRMLNSTLPTSLLKSSRTYEQWHIGELIHEPLSDRLRVAMIDIPFLRNMYLEYGYTAGLKLEHEFGTYLQSKLGPTDRIYHFTDANLLYVENNPDRDSSPHDLFHRLRHWIEEFKPDDNLNQILRMGIADYPFLPRAFTSINEKELLDILLMATSVSRELSIKEKTSHWVYLKAIDNTPAASFASSDIRKSCQIAIQQGLIKVHSSHRNEEIIKNLLKDG